LENLDLAYKRLEESFSAFSQDNYEMQDQREEYFAIYRRTKKAAASKFDHPATSNVCLEDVRIPKFNGEVRNWAALFNLFQKLVHNNNIWRYLTKIMKQPGSF